MKSIFKKFSICAMALVVAAMPACTDDFLVEEPQTSKSIEQILSDNDNIQYYLNGLYAKLRQCRNSREGLRLNHGTDELQIGFCQQRDYPDKGSFDTFSPLYNSENSNFSQLWNLRFPIAVQAAQARQVLVGKLAADSTNVDLKSFLGQAAFYEATALFEMVWYWGELPITTINPDGTIQMSGRRPLNEVYEHMIDLYTTAVENLPAKRQGDGRIPTQWTAKVMLAKIYMAAETPEYRDYTKAKELLKDVVDNGGFSLMPNYADLWDHTQNCDQESIWTYYFNNVTDKCQLQWYCGSRAASDWGQRCPHGGYDEALPTVYAYSTVAQGGIWEEGDTRYDATIRTNFDWNGKKADDVSGFGDDQLDPHIKKYEDDRIVELDVNFWDCGKNTYFLRYADVLMLYAEALNECAATADAVAIINDQIRARAWGWKLPDEMKWDPGMSQDNFRKNILDERMRELMAEMWRRYDLIRTGKYVDYTKKHNKWAKESGNMQDFHKRFPVPYTEITQNEYISTADQNPGLR